MRFHSLGNQIHCNLVVVSVGSRYSPQNVRHMSKGTVLRLFVLRFLKYLLDGTCIHQCYSTPNK